MRIIKVIGKAEGPHTGSEISDELDVHVADNATEEEVEAAIKLEVEEWFFNNFNYGWERIENDQQIREMGWQAFIRH